MASRSDRRSKRRRPPRNSRLKSAALSVRLLDLSDQGMAIETRSALRIGACYPFSLRGDPTDGGPFRGRVLWCRVHRLEPAENGDIHTIYRAGVQRLRPEEESEVAESAEGD
jgi:PilZ domain